MARIKTEKNLLVKRDQYNAYYGDFRGVDFSNDHTQTLPNRFSYLVNMYKDYWSKQGKAIETVPGFRRAFAVEGNEQPIYGIHSFDGNVLVHMGKSVYRWNNYPYSCGVLMKANVVLDDPVSSTTISVGGRNVTEYAFEIDLSVVAEANKGRIGKEGRLVSLTEKNGSVVTNFDKLTYPKWTFSSTTSKKGDYVYITYYEDTAASVAGAFGLSLNAAKSTSFPVGDKLYIIDGSGYTVAKKNDDGISLSTVTGYVPTRYVAIDPTGKIEGAGQEYEQKNLLSKYFKNTFIADGNVKEFPLKEKAFGVVNVSVYGESVSNDKWHWDRDKNAVIFDDAPPKPSEKGYTDAHAGVVVTAEYEDGIGSYISGCTIGCVFDNRLFLSGNKNYPNRVWFSHAFYGIPDVTYFGADDWFDDGIGSTPITGMVTVADTLMVLKKDDKEEGAVYFHTPLETGIDIAPKAYPRAQGLSGIGCIGGACTSFLDDPVYVSRLGVEAMGTLSVRHERAVEHRSSLVDAKLVNADLKNAFMEEWNGYLFLFVDGDVYLADSRQRYTDDTGVMQYEWYYLSGIGVYDGQYESYTYSDAIIDENVTVHHIFEDQTEKHYKIETAPDEMIGMEANPADDEGKPCATVSHCNVGGVTYHYVISSDKSKAYLCDAKGNCIGGTFKPATAAKTLDGNLYFGTENGVVCLFNFDKRDEYGEILPEWYSFDNRVILCGCATKMDNCGIPHLTKSTVKKSMVIKTKSMQASAIKMKVRTNRDPYKQVARITSALFSFDRMNFEDFSFLTMEESLFTVREKEKKWVEKQIYLYSDEYMKPFALFYISFRYFIAGRYKQ